MTYDQAHKELWNRIVKILKSALKNRSTRSRLNTIKIIPELKHWALQQSPALPIPHTGLFDDCYACELSSLRLQKSQAKHKKPYCNCFLKWPVEYRHVECVRPGAPYLRFRIFIERRNSLESFTDEDLKEMASCAEQIRDLPFKRWYKPVEIDAMK